MSDESARDKLRRLRRDAPPKRATQEASAEANEQRASVYSRLARRDARAKEASDVEASSAPLISSTNADSSEQARGVEQTAASETEVEAAALVTKSLARRATRSAWVTVVDALSPGNRAPSERELTHGLPTQLATESHAGDSFLARVSSFDADHAHGAWRLREYADSEAATLALLARDERLRELDLSRAVFLDTETSGLSGGAGTYVFLVGLGRFTSAGFEVWQGFLQSPADERALLGATAERIADSPLIISFFGKAFDRHRLEDKMRLHRIAPPFEGRAHLDLYHPLRRLYRGAFADTRLRTLESELCRVARTDDLPGSFAPAAWFDFLAGRAHRLEGVFQHNLDDVLSLVTLAAHAGSCTRGARACGTPLAGPATQRCEGIARSMLHARRRDEALTWLESTRDHSESEEARARLQVEIDALRAKRARKVSS